MAWDFSTEPEFEEKLDWIRTFVREEVEPLDVLFPGSAAPFAPPPEAKPILAALRQEVKDRDLWACHIGPELGGKGYGQLKLALMNEILGRSSWAPSVFGSQAPDSGNAEILAHYGTPGQKERYLQPLLDGEIVSCYSMTEPQAGADPREFTCRAERDGDEWVINGEKYFSSHADIASFLIVMVITDPEVSVYEGSSMFLVPTDTPGLEIVRHVGLGGEEPGTGHHGHLRFTDARVPAENLLGDEGKGFLIAQTRLGGGRVHHAMRTVGMAQRAFDMMCERALSRVTAGEVLAKKQMVQDVIAQSAIDIAQFRLLVLHTAWLIDQSSTAEARTAIAMVKVQTPRVLTDVVERAMHLHGAIGVSNELPLIGMWQVGPILGIADGPTEVHKVTIARQVLKGYRPAEGVWPREFRPARLEAARAKYAEYLEHEVANS